MKPYCIYVIGSLRNPEIPVIGNKLREAGFEAFDDWYGAGPRADDHWLEYEKLRGRSMIQALGGRAAQNTFNFDKTNIERSDAVLLALPAGKSGHQEFGYARGLGKPGVILFDKEPERWDVMYNFASSCQLSIHPTIAFFKILRTQKVYANE